MQKIDTQKLLENDFDFTFSKYIDEGWTLFKEAAGQYIGFCVLLFVIEFIISFIPGLNLINGFLSAILTSGYFIFAHAQSGKNNPEFGHFFKGFDFAGPIILYRLVLFLFILPVMLIFIFMFLPFDLFLGNVNPESFEFEDFFTFRALIGFPIVLAFVLYLTVAYVFVLPLITISKLGFWEAMETSRKVATQKFWPILGFLMIILLINIAGAIPCGLGLIVTFPLSLLAVYVAYKDVFQVGLDPLADQIANFGETPKDINTESEDRERPE